MQVCERNKKKQFYRVILLGGGVLLDGVLPPAGHALRRLDPDHGADTGLVEHVRHPLDPLLDEDLPGQLLLPLSASKVPLQLNKRCGVSSFDEM